jgi:integrase
MPYSFTLFNVRLKNGLTWNARFWDEYLYKYTYSRTTCIPAEGKKERHNGFVLESTLHLGKFVSYNFFRYWVVKELTAIVITREQQKKRDLTPHNLQNTFVTLAQFAKIADVEIRTLAGHKNIAVMQNYKHVFNYFMRR